MAAQVVATVTHFHQGLPGSVYHASRVYYPAHPSNAVELDDATTGARIMLFGDIRVEHIAPDPGPKDPIFPGLKYYAFWAVWLAALVGAVLWFR